MTPDPSPGYVPVGPGIGAAVLATGLLNVVTGSLWDQIQRERRDGPRWVEAVREANDDRRMWAAGWRHLRLADGRLGHVWVHPSADPPVPDR